MGRFVIDHPAPSGGWEEIKPRLQQALSKDLPVRLRERWEPEALHLEGAGARATIRLRDGCLRAEADLRPPASFFSAIIERELRHALEKAWPRSGDSRPT